MPNIVEIIEPARNVVQVTTSPVTVEITEAVNTVEVAALSRAVGNATLVSGIDITNTIGDAIAGGTYSAGTTLEAIVRDLIAPFLEPAFVSVSWSATGTHQADGETLLLECGVAATVSSVSVTWSNPESLDDNTALQVTDITAFPNQTLANQSIADYGALSVPYVITLNYALGTSAAIIPLARTLRISTGYLGNNGTGSLVGLTYDAKVAHRHRTYVFANQLSAVSTFPVNTLTGLLATTPVFSTLAVDPQLDSQEISVSCTAETANTSNYTWIFIPSAATLAEVTAEVGGRSVADYTESFVFFDNSGSYWSVSVGGATPTYKAYRSNQTGAFDSDVVLKLTITH